MSTPSSKPSSSQDVALASSFVVPPVFDAIYFNVPDIHSVLVHAISSSETEGGFQAILCFHPRPDLPSHLGLPLLSTYEEKAFLQTAPASHSFIHQTQTSRGHSMQITVTEYLILLQFIVNDWSRLKSKLENQLTTMREGTDPIYMAGYLVFYNHGSSHFRVSLSSRLVFAACVESRDASSFVRAWLEKRSPPDQNEYQEMALPMNSLVLLTQDTQGTKALIDQMSTYKNRSRKRSKPVVS